MTSFFSLKRSCHSFSSTSTDASATFCVLCGLLCVLALTPPLLHLLLSDVTKLNAAIASNSELEGKSLDDIMKTSTGGVFNNAAQVTLPLRCDGLAKGIATYIHTFKF